LPGADNRTRESGLVSGLPSLPMKTLLGGFTILLFGLFSLGQASTSNSSDPIVVKFVAPPYPRAAKDQRMMGTTVSEISIGPDGSVRDVQTIRAHPVFANLVRDALKQWRFRAENQEYRMEMTVSFEFDDACEGTDKHPISTRLNLSGRSSIPLCTADW